MPEAPERNTIYESFLFSFWMEKKLLKLNVQFVPNKFLHLSDYNTPKHFHFHETLRLRTGAGSLDGGPSGLTSHSVKLVTFATV